MKAKQLEPVQITAILGFLSLFGVGLWLLIWATPDYQFSGNEPTLAVIITVVAGVFAISAIFAKEHAK